MDQTSKEQSPHLEEPAKQDKKTRVALMVAVFGIILFLAIVITLPFQSGALKNFFEKTRSSADEEEQNQPAIGRSNENLISVSEKVDAEPGQILVKAKDEPAEREMRVKDKVGKKHNGKLKQKLEALNILVMDVPVGKEKEVIDDLKSDPDVLYAEPDYIRRLSDVIPSDTYFKDQWALENRGGTYFGLPASPDADIDAPRAWDFTQGAGIKVAVIDTGIDLTHPDLVGRIGLRKNFANAASGILDLEGHGTHIAGIIAANMNTTGVVGVCPQCTIMVGKVVNDNGLAIISWEVDAIRWATDNGAKVINISLGGVQFSQAEQDAVQYATNREVVIAASAGNRNNNTKEYPGALNSVIAVAATNPQDRKASFSSYGPNWVDVAAPGEGIFSTVPTGLKYASYSGTSMAAPMVAGTAALIWSTKFGTSRDAVRRHLEWAVDKTEGTGTYWAYGRINAAYAVTPDISNPNVAITFPANGASLRRGNTITIKADAIDVTTYIAKVEFFVNSNLKCTKTEAPFSCNWTVNTQPQNTITAKAYDPAGNTATHSITISTHN